MNLSRDSIIVLPTFAGVLGGICTPSSVNCATQASASPALIERSYVRVSHPIDRLQIGFASDAFVLGHAIPPVMVVAQAIGTLLLAYVPCCVA